MPDGQQIPPELMQMMQGGGQPQGGAVPPVSSPMSTPQEPEGDKEGAITNVSMAMDLLEQALPKLGSDTDEGKSVLQALTTLSKKFRSKRDKNRELMPAELMNLIAAQPKGAMPPGMAQGGGAPQPGMPG